jgi:hypothetical protein
MTLLRRALIQSAWSPYHKQTGVHKAIPRVLTYTGKTLGGHSREATICQSRREASGETSCVDTLILGLLNSRINLYCVSHLVYGLLLQLL